MIVLDTTVLVYAVGEAHPLRGPCRCIIEAIAGGRIVASTTVEVIQEFAHVRARRSPRSDAAELARDFVHLLAPLLAVDEEVLLGGLELFQTSSTLGAFDGVLAATAMAHEAEALISTDTAFGEVVGLSYVHPNAPEAATLTR